MVELRVWWNVTLDSLTHLLLLSPTPTCSTDTTSVLLLILVLLYLLLIIIASITFYHNNRWIIILTRFKCHSTKKPCSKCLSVTTNGVNYEISSAACGGNGVQRLAVACASTTRSTSWPEWQTSLARSTCTEVSKWFIWRRSLLRIGTKLRRGAQKVFIDHIQLARRLVVSCWAGGIWLWDVVELVENQFRAHGHSMSYCRSRRRQNPNHGRTSAATLRYVATVLWRLFPTIAMIHCNLRYRNNVENV